MITATEWLDRALAAHRSGETAQALAYYNEAIRLDSPLASAYYNRSLVLEQIGDSDRAEADRHDAFRLDPAMAEQWRTTARAFSDAEVDLGNRAFESGDFGEALAKYESAARLNPHSAEAQ